MRFGYIHLDYYKNTQTDTYNLQEIGLAKALVELGHEMVIVFWVPKNDSRCNLTMEVLPGITIKYLKFRLHIIHHVLPDFEQLDNLGLDVLHLQCDNLLFVPEAINYCREKGWIHYCYVGTIHSSSKKAITRFLVDFLSQRNFFYLRKTKVFCKTPAVMHELQERNVTNVDWAPVGLDISIIPTITQTKSEIRRELAIPENKKIVFLVCALRQDKRPLDIFPLASLLGDKFLLVHVGIDGNQAEIYKAELSKGYNNIIFLGTVFNQEIHKYYKIADWVINFNPNEIFGMAILEAMFHNVTIVARHAPGPDCIIEDGQSGFLCDSVEEMAKIIKNGNKINGARNRLLEKFTWKASAKSIISYTTTSI